MHILVIGGTRFVGRHVTSAALARGHHVTLLHRGRSGPELFPQAEHLLADRDGDLSVLDGREFDATIDVCAYVPRQVRTLAQALDGRGGRYVYVSSVSAYDESAITETPYDEDSPLASLSDPTTEVVDNDTYGGLKAVCEQVATECFGDRVTIVRPTYVIGPSDYTYRFTYWVDRIADGGEVLAPGPQDAPVQVIDGRDMGEWIVGLVEGDVPGAFHAVSPAPPFGFEQMLQTIVDAVGPEGTRLTWVTPEFATDQGLDGSALPLWSEGTREPASAADPARAAARGLRPRPLDQTVRELLADERAEPTDDLYPGKLTREREAEVLAAWHAANPS